MREHEPDSEWSDPGVSLGMADRYQSRTIAGLFLTAGDNRRKTGLAVHITPATATPWHVYEQRPHPEHWHMTTVELAAGVAKAQDAARAAAEQAANLEIERRAVPKIIARQPRDDRWPWALITAARHRGDVAWVETTDNHAMDALGALPPIYIRSPRVRSGQWAAFFLGEPAAHDHRGVAIHAAFVPWGDRWYAREVALDQIEAALGDLSTALTTIPTTELRPPRVVYRCEECGELAITDSINDLGAAGAAYCVDHPGATIVCGPEERP